MRRLMPGWLRLRPPRSLRAQLLWGLLVPIVLLIVANTFSLYRQALASVNTAYDRTLLASAKAIGELLDVQGEGPQAHILARIPYSALEAFEADNRSRMTYRVSTAAGDWIDGAQDVAPWSGTLPNQGPYAALVHFYDDLWRGDAVRVAVLLQPVASATGKAMATIQVAETLELRQALARQILWDTLQRQALLVLVVTAVALLVVHHATRPIRALSVALDGRADEDWRPLDASALPGEVRPLTEATNRALLRLGHLVEHQKRFVRDAAHQLRTPLAVLKTQVQSARRGDVGPQEALADIERTIDRATTLANQMLSLAKVEQLRQAGAYAPVPWHDIVRELALEMAPLVADKDIDFGIETQACAVLAHPWMLREASRNLLHNAIRHTPRAGRLDVVLRALPERACLLVRDGGSGIPEGLRPHLFQPFATADATHGSGLGLTITREIMHALGGSIHLDNRVEGGRTLGLDAVLELPLAPL